MYNIFTGMKKSSLFIVGLGILALAGCALPDWSRAPGFLVQPTDLAGDWTMIIPSSTSEEKKGVFDNFRQKHYPLAQELKLTLKPDYTYILQVPGTDAPPHVNTWVLNNAEGRTGFSFKVLRYVPESLDFGIFSSESETRESAYGTEVVVPLIGNQHDFWICLNDDMCFEKDSANK